MRKHNYLVGYKGEGQCIYGRTSTPEGITFISLLTLPEAKEQAGELISQNGERTYKGVVYKLVEVKGE